MNATVFNVQHFSVQDGPGIRTTVFFKGCPMRCAWCHNPESQSGAAELFYHAAQCIGCGACVSACPRGLHSLVQAKHGFTRSGCVACGSCAQVCFAKALELSGKTVTAEALLSEIAADRQFYENTGGGVTFSGGEPLYQPAFVLELAKMCRSAGVGVCIETGGCCKTEDLLATVPYVQSYLFDFKLADDTLHKKYTGVSNVPIVQNLHALCRAGAQVVLRCPVIPDVNFTQAHFEAVARLAVTHGIKQIDLEPYHPIGLKKYGETGRTAAYRNEEFLPPEQLQPYASLLRQLTGARVNVL